MHFFHIGHRLFGRTHVRFRDDLQQWGTGAIQIDPGHALVILVQGFAGILFQMGAGHADHLAAAVFEFDGQGAVLHNWQFILTDLIALGQVRIKVILARKDRTLCDFGADGQTQLDRHGDRLFVQDRQHSR